MYRVEWIAILFITKYKNSSQLSLIERYQIEVLLKVGLKQKLIAE